MSVKLLFLAGSARQDSVNKKLAKLACKQAKAMGAEVEFIDLKDFPLPIYDGDLEERDGVPEEAKQLKKLFVECDGFFIASPEYNSSFSALLKNSLDWISRSTEEGEAPLVAYKGKVAAISSASPGGLGGLRGLVPLRMLLGNIAVTVVPNQFALGAAFGAFNENGNLQDDKQNAQLQSVVAQLVETTEALK